MRRKLILLLTKDFLTESSYKLSFALNFFSVIVTVATYYFIDKLFGDNINPYLNTFGTGYFGYMLVSMAFYSYLSAGIGSFSNRIRTEQLQGTLEYLLLTPTDPLTLLLGLGLWNLLIASFDVLIYAICGIFIFNMKFAHANLLSAGVIGLLTIVAFSCLGVFSASFVLIFKKGNPVAWVIHILEGLLGGVYFPVSVLPAGLQLVSAVLPITYAIRGLELALHRGYSLNRLLPEITVLMLFCLILVPGSVVSFRWAIDTCKRKGTLSQY